MVRAGWKCFARNIGRDVFLDFAHRALPHSLHAFRWKHPARQQHAAAVSRVTNSFGNACEKNFERGAERVRQHESRGEFLSPQAPAHLPDAFTRGESHDAIEARMAAP